MIQSSKLILNNLKKYTFLLKQLINRDFKVKYKRSVLGIVWSLLYPILMMTVMAIVFSNMFRFAVEGVNYLVYLMIGIVVWNYFTDATGVSLGSIIDNFSLISKLFLVFVKRHIRETLGVKFVFVVHIVSIQVFVEYVCRVALLHHIVEYFVKLNRLFGWHTL